MYKLIFTLSLAIGISFAMTVHPFEVPDENAHYSSLHYLANEGRMPTKYDKDNLSLEEMEVEKIFGIVEGKNKYSYHPEFRVEQVTGYQGKYEEFIQSLNTPANRETYATHQAALYPPLYYWLTLPFYYLVSDSDILTRLFASRFSSIILTALVVVVAYATGLEVFKKKYLAFTLAVMVLFYPMTTYIGGGVNSDNLHNLLFGLAMLLGIQLMTKGWSPTRSLSIGVVIGLDLITKPQAYILIPIFALAVILRWRWDEWRQMLVSSIYILAPIFLLAGWQEIPKFMGGNPYVVDNVRYSSLADFQRFATGYISTHLREMPVWYWGVFKWFGVILPRPLWWIGTRILGLAALGLVIKLIQDLRARTFSPLSRIILLAVGANLIYAAALFWFDWQFYQALGRSLGLQARYYMPLLISQLILIYLGITQLGWNQKIQESLRLALLLFFLSLQLTSFYVQLASYYDLNSVTTFIEQLSQYKPWFAKGEWWYLWFTLYFAGIISTTVLVLKSKSNKTL